MAKLKSKLFSRKFRNWLLHLVVSRQDLKSITGYTLQALQQDGKQWQDKIDLLQPLYDSFDTGLVGQAGGECRARLPNAAGRNRIQPREAVHEAAYKRNFAALEEDNPTLFKEFFPSGRTGYSAASRQTLGTAFARFVQTLSANKAAVTDGANLLKEAQPLAEQYAQARQTQDARKKQVKSAAGSLDADETDLLVELFGVYAALLAHYYKTPERAEAYFDFSVLPPLPAPARSRCHRARFAKGLSVCRGPCKTLYKAPCSCRGACTTFFRGPRICRGVCKTCTSTSTFHQCPVQRLAGIWRKWEGQQVQ